MDALPGTLRTFSTQMCEEEVSQLMRCRCELHGGRVVLIDLHPVLYSLPILYRTLDARKERCYVHGKRFTFRVYHIENQRHRTKRPQNQERASAFPGLPAKAFKPVVRRCSISQPGLLYL